MEGFIFPVPFAGVVVLLSTLGLGYVWLGCRCEALGRELKALEIEKAALDKKHMNERLRWTCTKSPQNIEKSLAKHNIVMTWPRRDQVVRLSDVPTSPTAFTKASAVVRLRRTIVDRTSDKPEIDRRRRTNRRTVGQANKSTGSHALGARRTGKLSGMQAKAEVGVKGTSG